MPNFNDWRLGYAEGWIGILRAYLGSELHGQGLFLSRHTEWNPNSPMIPALQFYGDIPKNGLYHLTVF